MATTVQESVPTSTVPGQWGPGCEPKSVRDAYDAKQASK